MTTPVGFVGLGNMGSRMAARLLDAGYEVVGFDPARSGTDGLVTRWASSLEEFSDLPTILMSLPDRSVVERVVWGAGDQPGLLAILGPDHVVADMTTSSPETSRRAASACGERGAEFLDVGLSGGAAGAESGALTFMVGGSAQALGKIRHTLDVLASTIEHVGVSGAGHVLKILNNFLNAINLSAASEVLVAAKAAGLDIRQALEVINHSSGANWATENRFPRIIEGDYLDGGLTSWLMMKDIQLYLDVVAEMGVSSLHASGPVAAFGSAIQRGYGDQISNRVVDAIGDMAGGVRIQATEPPSAHN